MNEILTALWPVFALLCIGYGIRRLNFPDDSFWEPAEKLIYFLLFPVLLVYKLSLAEIAAVPIFEVAAAVVGLLAAGSMLLILVQRLRPLSGAAFTSVYQGGMRFNTYVGLAASAALYGDDSLAIAAVVIALMVPLLNVLCVLVFSAYTQRESSVASTLKALCKNPLILACLLGILLNLSGLGLPSMVSSVAQLLSSMALPLGLLAVGAGLNLTALRSAGGSVIYSSIIKLLFFPLLMLLICSLFIDSYLVAAVLVLFSALPTASTAYILARQLSGDAPMMAAIITAQTILSFLTIPVVLALFNQFF
ncbi:AEC family transporter [Amphritea sp. HPY]|uniref:AEC family transporter n=1 Tax=Amphritea sp. HPY TaxID=3421652 RepID=UPI003D7D38DF